MGAKELATGPVELVICACRASDLCLSSQRFESVGPALCAYRESDLSLSSQRFEPAGRAT